MNSSGHRAAILSNQFCDIGVGYGYSSSNRYKHLWTQNFGRKQETQSCKDNPDPGDDGDLTNGKPKTNLSGSRGQWLHYKLTVPNNAQNLSVTIKGGSGDADLYMKFAKRPTSSDYDCRPYLYGNNESCTVNAPKTGMYYISVMAYSSYTGLTLTAKFDQ
ncbi:pre-peptidase C-terminal domain-containing protein [Endozoicomonas sp. SM1973]|uniref:Pre-peptidase C-terminal domain-containing protein n=2 Tax=Spartinivicinus marinus TaxID=2994442 RepID=A0A853IFR1_9GAMM|nr:pre-peptidase C-terminal domain-containing protein [Spartinivicinus marinus]